jgi:hypothetical protein
MSSDLFEGYMFVVDTDIYSGNFEREMCAYMTGMVGQCEVGEELAEVAKEELGPEKVEFFESEVCQMYDENGVSRPVTIWPTPGYFNDGRGNHWPDGADMDEVRVKYVEKAKEFLLPIIERNKKWIEEDPVKYDYLRKVVNTHLQDLEDAKTKDIRKWPAYQSVAIFFYREPDEETIELLKARAHKFTTGPHSKSVPDYVSRIAPKIEGFRLLKAEVNEIRKL